MLEKDITALVATDGSDYSLKAARKASLMLKNGILKKLIVVYVAETDKNLEVLTSLKESLQEEGNEIINRTLAVMPDLNHVESQVLFGEPYEQICEFAHQKDINLIIMGAKGRGEIMDVLVGSVCNKVVHHAPCSVMLIRNPDWD